MREASRPPVDGNRVYDLIVVGGGNAALCAAMTARRAGAGVLLLESAPHAFRGGNSRHTRNLRYLHERANAYLTGPYREEEFWDDLLRVTGGNTDERLARLTIRESADLGSWIEEHGGRFQPPLRGTLGLSRTNAFFLGGGKALMNAYYRTAARLGVDVRYEADVQDVEPAEDGAATVRLAHDGESSAVRARAVVVASGGFQANIPWLREHWGPAADNFVIRGTPYDTGRVLRALLDRGAKPVGDPTQCHAVAVDARAPAFDGGIVTRLDCVPFGIVVNRHARRFYDEGEDLWPKRYAIWGRLIARQPGQIAYAILDSRSIDAFMPSAFPPVRSPTIAGLATALDLDPAALESTVTAFNRCVTPGTFDAATLDTCRTEGLTPPKSHWARRIDTPPFFGYPLRPGITFTYLGVTVDEEARVIGEHGRPFANIFAAGEVMAGNVLGQGYVAGFGMTLGTVFGRIAGKGAARRALGHE